jgi:hypothetical protein
MNEAFSNTDNIPDKEFNVNKWKRVAGKEVTCQLHCHLFTEETLLGAFAKLRKATISCVMSVCPHGTTGLPLDGF